MDDDDDGLWTLQITVIEGSSGPIKSTYDMSESWI